VQRRGAAAWRASTRWKSRPTIRRPSSPSWRRCSAGLWNWLYDGVEFEHIENLSEVGDGAEIIYVPCHRSHMDYLLLSYVIYRKGFAVPHVAAGVNLNMPVIGRFLRKGGAFFLRRSFKGDALYAWCSPSIWAS
jgi:glycerol-3-phosphate O-acyltransferase